MCRTVWPLGPRGRSALTFRTTINVLVQSVSFYAFAGQAQTEKRELFKGLGQRKARRVGSVATGRGNGHAGGHASEAAVRVASACAQALAVFDIEPPLTPVRLKARYKLLVKEHHPDAHGGDKAAEEKLKIINQAYATLKASYFN